MWDHASLVAILPRHHDLLHGLEESPVFGQRRAKGSGVRVFLQCGRDCVGHHEHHFDAGMVMLIEPLHMAPGASPIFGCHASARPVSPMISTDEVSLQRGT
jgi:hypothetical protein